MTTEQSEFAFKGLDVNKDDQVNAGEFLMRMRKNPIIRAFLNAEAANTKEILDVFHVIDSDGNNQISWEEFSRWYCPLAAE